MVATLIFSLLVVSIATISSSNQINISGCEVDTSQIKFDLNCTGLGENGENVRIGKDNKLLEIECNTWDNFNYTIFPQLNLTEVNDVFVDCILPDEHNSFGHILKHFGINRIEKFTAKNIRQTFQQFLFANGFESLIFLKLTKSHLQKLNENIFKPLKNLVRLNLRNNKITDVPVNVFHSLVNLRTLELDKNQISFLSRHTFARLGSLETLHISFNELKSLEEGIFTRQKRLEELNLDDNEISDLHRNIFADVENLEVLLLSNNRLKNLDEGIFGHQKNLRKLDLDNNEFSVLPANVFAALHKLEKLDLSNNHLQTLGKGTFKNQNQLESLHLHNNKLERLTQDTFVGLHSLATLYLDKNNFKAISSDSFQYIPTLQTLHFGNVDTKCAISDKIFANNTELTEIYLQRVKISKEFRLPSTGPNNVSSVTILGDQKRLDSVSLSNNDFTDLLDGIFDSLDKLTSLTLSHSNLTIISRLLLRNLHKLVEISLNHNHIESIESDAFASTNRLEKIDLSYNQLKYFDETPFIYLEKLKSLNLSNNHLTTIPPGMQILRKLSMLDLGYNNITLVKYGDIPNSDSAIQYTEYNQIAEKMEEIGEDLFFKFVIFLNDNPLMCDCSMQLFLLIGGDSVKRAIVKHLAQTCGDEPHVCENSIDSISIECPTRCDCLMNSVNVKVDCSNRTLTMLPSLPSLQQLNLQSFEIYINNNNLTELPSLQHNKHVITVQASHNNIEYIKLENLSPSLRFLGLSHNKIKSISADVVRALNNQKELEIIFFANNPWQCDCSTDSNEFIAFFMKKMAITDLQETKCRLPSGVDYEFSSEVIKDVCSKEEKLTVSIIVTIVAIVIAMLAILGILFYKYKQLLIIWLYTHNMQLWCMDEDEFDKDKKYDAFLSYTYFDEDVAIEILNELENGNPPFNLCAHEREFVPGRLIKNSIAESMDNSCRTIVILSRNFLNSNWGMKEFTRAYDVGLAEKRMRLIIVIHGDIGNSDQLHPTIKSYLKTHTYIKWGDPWFWDKMRYAMPHRRR